MVSPEVTTPRGRDVTRPSLLDRRQRRAVVLAIVALSAVAAATAGARPTDLRVADVALAAGVGALVPWCAAHARRWTWCWVAGVAGVATVDRLLPFSLAVAALAIALAASRTRHRRRMTGALVGALAIQALLRVGDLGPVGVPALLTLLAVVPVVLSGRRLMGRRRRRWLDRGVVAVALVAVVGAAAAVVAALLVRDPLVGAVDRSEAAVAGVGAGEQEGTLADLDAARSDFAEAGDLLGSPLLWPARAVPVVGPHVGALGELAAVGEDLTATSSTTVADVDYDRLRYRSGRINLAEVERVAPALRTIRGALADAEARTADLDSPWLVAPLTDEVDDLRGRLVETRDQAATAEVALDLAPEMLGADGPRRYLVVFPTESESRGGGGFVGNFVVLDAVDGEVRLTESARIRTLIDARPEGERRLEGLDDYVDQYGRFRPEDFNQDILLSPHFPDDAAAFAQVADQSLRGPVDAVISMSPAALGSLLTFTGPLPVPGREAPLVPDEAEQFLQLGQYLEYQDDEQRADALEGLTREVFDRLTEGTLPSPRALGEQLGPLVPTGGLRVWSTRPEEEDLLRRLDVTGELPEAGGHDLVHVSGINGGQNKIDVFLQREVEVVPAIDPDTGEVTSTVRVTLRNDAPAGGLPRYVIGNAQGDPPGTNRHLLTVFSPLELEGARVGDRSVGVTVGEERGYRTYGLYLDVPPGGEVTLELSLRGTIPDMEGYRLVVPAQPMVNPDALTVSGPVLDEPDVVLDRTRTFGAPGG
ncbi:DUF4012 domain-containing protein [Iamia majanohamensis]|uniref:DUF4012 domain-containing protein n=1 Tax=Iamia majanohamensis TaxID=467976 RepID=A0AAF0BWZ1_9ACTN|nr:DUF4012 domain-containing protein [Iamia majanohamensis]WCO68543.1 DUF4012 domain-containing protein [Iamia majanohamensis]